MGLNISWGPDIIEGRHILIARLGVARQLKFVKVVGLVEMERHKEYGALSRRAEIEQKKSLEIKLLLKLNKSRQNKNTPNAVGKGFSALSGDSGESQ